MSKCERCKKLTEQIEREAAEFNAGFAAGEAGHAIESEPCTGIVEDMWKPGWAWGVWCRRDAERRRPAEQSPYPAPDLAAQGNSGAPAGITEAELAELERHASQTMMAEGIMQCIDASWRENQAQDWTRPELVLQEYVDELRAQLAAMTERAEQAERERDEAREGAMHSTNLAGHEIQALRAQLAAMTERAEQAERERDEARVLYDQVQDDLSRIEDDADMVDAALQTAEHAEDSEQAAMRDNDTLRAERDRLAQELAEALGRIAEREDDHR